MDADKLCWVKDVKEANALILYNTLLKWAGNIQIITAMGYADFNRCNT